MVSQDEIDQFCSITDFSDRAAAEKFIEIGGSVENAISLFFEHGASFVSAQPAAASGAASGSVSPIESDDALAQRLQSEAYQTDEPRAPIQPTRETLVSPGYGGFPGSGGMFSSAGYSRNRVPGFGTQFSAVFGQDIRPHSSGAGGEDSDDEDDGLTDHQRRLAMLFRPPFDIMSTLTFDEARAEAKAQRKWLLVNIQDTSDFRCQTLNRDFWSDKEVKNIVRENFVFLQYQSNSPEGQQYIQFYPFYDEYPHIAIIDPVTGERLKVWSENPKPITWMEEVFEFLAKYSLEAKNQKTSGSRDSHIDVGKLSEEQQIEWATQRSLGRKERPAIVAVRDSDSDSNSILVADSDEEEDEDLSGLYSEDSDEGEGGEGEGEEGEDMEDVAEVRKPAGTATEPISVDDSDAVVPEEGLSEEEVFAAILSVHHDEPTDSDPSRTTRIQIRGDGFRVVKRVNLTDKVKTIYETIKADIPQVAGGKYFVLTFERRNLIEDLNKTVDEAGLKNSSVLMEIVE